MGVVYNERSWAIDLIGHIKIVVSSTILSPFRGCISELSLEKI